MMSEKSGWSAGYSGTLYIDGVVIGMVDTTVRAQSIADSMNACASAFPLEDVFEHFKAMLENLQEQKKSAPIEPEGQVGAATKEQSSRAFAPEERRAMALEADILNDFDCDSLLEKVSQLFSVGERRKMSGRQLSQVASAYQHGILAGHAQASEILGMHEMREASKIIQEHSARLDMLWRK